MKRLISFVVAAFVAPSLSAGGLNPDWSIARQWDEEALQAIRLSTSRPPVHARNLYFLAATMYDAWAAYDPTPRGVYFFEKHTVADVDAARRESMSYAAYRVLKARFVTGNGPNVAQIQAALDALFLELGYDASFTSLVGTSPAAIGNRAGAAALAAGLADGSNEANNYAPSSWDPLINLPFFYKLQGIGPEFVEPNEWQSVATSFLVFANGFVLPLGPAFLCPHWKGVTPFSLNVYDRNPANGVAFDQGPPPLLGSAELSADVLDILERSAALDATTGDTVDISPGVSHNSPLGSYEQPGHGVNPVTGEPYESNVVLVADYGRALAETWFDGLSSSQPAGHWHEIANAVADTPGFEFKWMGAGPSLPRLEWDVKTYLALAGAGHDACISAWGMKTYEAPFPITRVRQMGGLGQSMDPRGTSYSPDGLPGTPELLHIVTPEDVAPGGPFEDIIDRVYSDWTGEPIALDDHVGDVMIRTWLGGYSAGAPVPSSSGALPGHVYRDASGWHIGGFALGANDSAGAANPKSVRPSNVQLSEIRVGQPRDDTDDYIEIVGPPRASLDGLTLMVLGDESHTTYFAKGRVQHAIDLSGHVLDRSGVFVIARTTLSLTTPDLVQPLRLEEIGNCTFALVTGFSGYVGQMLDWDENGTIDLTVPPWTSVIDKVALRRDPGPAGIYLGAPTIGPQDFNEQEHGVGWLLAERGLAYQPSSVPSPPTPSYASGHSCISRAAAEVLTRVTGSAYFPGGLSSELIARNALMFEQGPSAAVNMQWASYYDAADDAGVAGVWAGVWTKTDDLAGRIAGSKCGARAFARADALFKGLAKSPDLDGDGAVNSADLALLLGEWGNGSGPGDIDGDGSVGSADLAILLGAWS